MKLIALGDNSKHYCIYGSLCVAGSKSSAKNSPRAGILHEIYKLHEISALFNRSISKFKCCIKDMLCIEKGLKTEAVGKDPICWLKENQIKLVDRPRLPYLNAVINVLKSTAL